MKADRYRSEGSQGEQPSENTSTVPETYLGSGEARVSPDETRKAVEAACLRHLARREYGRDELRRKLLAKGHPEPVVDQVLADFVREGLQSDARFAESYFRSRTQKGYGAFRVRQELRQRGITRDDEPDFAVTDWDDLLRRVYVKKFGTASPDSREDRAARERFLLRRGFGSDQIHRLFRRLLLGDHE